MIRVAGMIFQTRRKKCRVGLDVDNNFGIAANLTVALRIDLSCVKWSTWQTETYEDTRTGETQG